MTPKETRAISRWLASFPERGGLPHCARVSMTNQQKLELAYQAGFDERDDYETYMDGFSPQTQLHTVTGLGLPAFRRMSNDEQNAEVAKALGLAWPDRVLVTGREPAALPKTTPALTVAAHDRREAERDRTVLILTDDADVDAFTASGGDPSPWIDPT